MHNRKYIRTYTFLFLLTALLSFSMFFLNDKSFIKIGGDGFLQQYPYLVKMHYLLADLLQGKGFTFWSHEAGLGADTLGILSKYLASPFSYVAAAFPVSRIDTGYTVACILRLYCAGLAVAGFLKHRKYSSMLCVIGGVSYALCFWAIGSIEHDIFLDPLVFFPLLIFGIDLIMEGGKPYLLILAVCLSVATYPYFAYMSAIYCGLYVLIGYWSGAKKRSVPDFFLLILRLGLAVGIGCCLASPLLIPALRSLLHSSKSSGTTLNRDLNPKEFLQLLPTLITSSSLFGHFSFTGAGAFFAAFIPITIPCIRDRKKRTPVVLFLFSLLALCIPVWGSLMNAFSYRVGRWCYILAFFYIWAIVCSLDGLKSLTPRQTRACLFWVALLIVNVLVCGIFYPVLDYRLMVPALWNLLFVFVFLAQYAWFPKRYPRWLYLLIVCNLGVHYIMLFSPNAGNELYYYGTNGQPCETYQKSVLRVCCELEDPDFYRVDHVDHLKSDGSMNPFASLVPNEAIFWNVPTLTGYFSLLDNNIQEFNNEIANGTIFRRVNLYSNDNRTRLNFLEGVRYYLYDETQERAESRKLFEGSNYREAGSIDEVGIMEADITPGIGYVFNKILPASSYRVLGPLAKEQSLMQAVVLAKADADRLSKTADIEVITRDSLDLQTQPLKHKVDKESDIHPQDHTFTVEEAPKDLILQIPDVQNAELYVSFEGLKKAPLASEESTAEAAQSSPSAALIATGTENEPQPKVLAPDEFEYFVSRDHFSKRVHYPTSEGTVLSAPKKRLTNIGFFEHTEGTLKIRFNTPGEYTYDSVSVYAVPTAPFVSQAQTLSDQRLIITEQENDRLSGTVHAETDGVLFLSIPWSRGWQITIDGETQKLCLADTCFMATSITAGDHTVTLTYHSPWLLQSLLLFLFGALCTIGIVIYHHRRR